MKRRIGLVLVAFAPVLFAGCARMGRVGVGIPAHLAPGVFDSLIAVAPRSGLRLIGQQPDHISFRTRAGDWLTYRAEGGQIVLEVLVAKIPGASPEQVAARIEKMKRFGLGLIGRARRNARRNEVFR